jgi:uncharacterized protein YndB with AHSA1/START domain
MTDDAQFGAARQVRFERMLPAAPERVWEFLTDTARLTGWYGEGTIESRVGGAVTLMGGHVRGTVTCWMPARRLTYGWNVFAPGEAQSPYPESYVSFELAPQGRECRLTLTHLPVLERFEKQNAMGWHTFLDMLAAAARGEIPGPRSDYMRKNASRYGVDLAHLVK